MDTQDLQELLAQANQELLRLSSLMEQLNTAVNEVMTENNRLRILHKSSEEPVSHDVEEHMFDTDSPTISGKSKLQSFYDEGIHICHPYFGTKRDADEACIFCQGLLDVLANQDEKSDEA